MTMETAIETAVPTTNNPFTKLTSREREVAQKLALGTRSSVIADMLGISVKTVDTHRGHLLKKLEIDNNVELARLAIKYGEAPLP